MPKVFLFYLSWSPTSIFDYEKELIKVQYTQNVCLIDWNTLGTLWKTAGCSERTNLKSNTDVSVEKSGWNLLEEEIPSHISCIREASLRNFCSDRVDYWGLFFLCEEVRDRGRHQELAYMNKKILVG